MSIHKWRVVVAKLGAPVVLHESLVEANNWMSALRAARQSMAERPSMPPGASCSIDAEGVATVFDPGERRKFVLTPLLHGHAEAAAPREPPPAAKVAAPPNTPATSAPAKNEPTKKKQRFQTVALIPEGRPAPKAAIPVSGPTGAKPSAYSRAMPAPPQAPPRSTAPQAQPASSAAPRQAQASSAAPHAANSAAAAAPAAPPRPAGKKAVFQTVGFADGLGTPARASQHPRPESGPPRPSRQPRAELELLLERDEEPSSENPLCYRERAYLMPKGATVPEAEAALRWKLADVQQQLEGRPRGKFVNLAVFDHRWQDVPERPPVIVLQWRDWRGEVTADYPAAARVSSAPPPSRPEEDRLAEIFEALEALPRMHTPAEGLDFVVRLLERTIPAEAISACLYDINTDELRFVALAGAGAASRQGQAVPRAAGLFGQAAHAENQASVFRDVRVEPHFDLEVDGRPGIEPRSMLLRPVAHDRQLLGMLQLINREGADGFSAEDVNAVNYIAERLGEFLHAARTRRRPLA